MKIIAFIYALVFSLTAQAEMKDTNIILDSQHYEGKATFNSSGVMHGPFVAYTQYSQLVGTMKNGKPEGVVTETGTDGNGKKIKVITTFNKGKVTGAYENWLDGKLIEKGSYLNGKAVGEWQVTENGRLKIKNYSKKKLKFKKTAQQKKNEVYLRRMKEAAVADSLHKAEKAKNRLKEIQRCIANAGNDVQKYIACQN